MTAEVVLLEHSQDAIEALDVKIDWERSNRCQVQIDGHDVVQIQFAEDGTAEVLVWASTHPDARELARHSVRWDERRPEDVT